MIQERLALDADALDRLRDDIDRLHADHPDSVDFVLRRLTDDDVVGGEIVGIDPEGVHATAIGPDGASRPVRIAFDEAPGTIEELRGAVYGLVHRARDLAGDDEPLTSLEREIAATTELRTWKAVVADTASITAGIRQITFEVALDRIPDAGPDEFFLVTPAGGPESRRAYYTARRRRAAESSLDMWFVLHGQEGSVAHWAANARPGDPASLWGPRSSYDPPPDTERLLLVADETGVAAVSSILEQDHRPAHVVIETSDPGSIVDLPARSGDRVDRVHRHATATSEDSLTRAVSTIDDLDPTTYAFGAAESRQVRAIRRHLSAVVGLDRTHIQMTGYWRRRVAG